MRALITRPEEDAGPIAAELAARDIEPVIEPLLTIEPIADAAVSLDGVQAVLVTSRNGVRALAAAISARDIPVFAVGESSAALAREMGFEHVLSAAGDNRALEALAADRLDPGDGALLHASGKAAAGDLAGALGRRGFDVRRTMLYEAVAATVLSERVRALIAGHEVELALFFSPRTAETFVILVRDAGLESACKFVTGVCLSPAVTQKLEGVAWRALLVAERPDLEAMTAAVDAAAASRT